MQQVTRDAQLREFLVAEQIEVAREFGSGYPGGAAAPPYLGCVVPVHAVLLWQPLIHSCLLQTLLPKLG